jgi:D-3-phosphoglycerate dehydrogenase
MLKAFVTSDLSASQLERLKGRCQVSLGGWGASGIRLTPEELVEAAAGYEILLVGYESLPGWAIDSLPKVQLIGCTRSTPINVDLEAASRRDIPVLHTPGRNTQNAAEFTLGLMLSAAHLIGQGHHALRSGHYLGEPAAEFISADHAEDVTWKLDGESPFKDLQGIELGDKRLGIIGLGRIGSRVAQLAQAFGMRVIAYSPYTAQAEAEDLNVELVDLDSLLRQADFISIHARVTPETLGMLGEREFGLMKPGAYLMVVSRAAIVDQAALIKTLQERRIAGAALDVYWYEPLPANHPLLSMDNVTLTPHLAGASQEVRERHSQIIVDDVIAWLDGRRPEHLANPQVWPAGE